MRLAEFCLMRRETPVSDMGEQQEVELAVNAQRVMTYITFSMRVLSMRVAVLAAMILSFAITAWAMAYPDPYRAGLSVLCWVAVYLPTLFAERKM
jgi:hypothetical protein